VDLGIGRAPGSDSRTAKALAAGPGAWPAEYFPQRVADLRRWLHDALEPDHPFAGVQAMPAGPTAPELWLLGSSAASATYAALHGVPFAFAHFINPRDAVAVVRAYRAAFRPSAYLAAPRALLAVFAVCAETEADARRLARSRELFLVRLHQNARLPYPSRDEVEAHIFTPEERAILAQTAGRALAGTPEQLRAELTELAAAAEAEEVMVLTITPDFASRLRSYELLAEAFALQRAPERATVCS
jgi:luciferase family oxidoreductase group 1